MEENIQAFVKPTPVSLNDKIDRVENRLGKLGLGLSGEALDILVDLDDIKERLLWLTEQDHPAKSELAQYDTICKTIKKEAPLLLKEIGGAHALATERELRKPDPANWWWYLEGVIAEQVRVQVKRQAIIFGVVVLVLGVVVLAYQLFFKPDPKVIAVLDARNNAETLINKGNIDAAIKEVDLGLAKNPASGELLIFKGTLYDVKGQPEIAKTFYDQATKLAGNQETFYLMRAQDYQELGLNDASIADMMTLLKINPKSAKAYLVLGQAKENKKDITGALDAYNKSSEVGNETNDMLSVAESRVKLGMLMQSAQVQLPNGITPTPGK